MLRKINSPPKVWNGGGGWQGVSTGNSCTGDVNSRIPKWSQKVLQLSAFILATSGVSCFYII
jgi:hypothetical protein